MSRESALLTGAVVVEKIIVIEVGRCIRVVNLGIKVRKYNATYYSGSNCIYVIILITQKGLNPRYYSLWQVKIEVIHVKVEPAVLWIIIIMP